ncbi:2-C-methyl-D-erythritol 4-phosphate cytidylyltransferase [Candidatus Marinimicrobia bacterium]|nr:2-C-methyl-D-erythritol 4-phosphate cytidylyltransferase [Candidatus Neomarinimicrobiota bacterium]
MNTAIILAAGNSIRLGGNTPKQFIRINDRLLIDYSISTFEKIKNINRIIIVVSKKYYSLMNKEYPNHTIILGGETRKESSYNGLLACDKSTKKVLIHDSARPLITKDLINNCINNLDNYNAVTLAIPIKDTIAKIKNSSVIKIDDRETLRAIQTPQGFNFTKIFNSHIKDKKNYTDDIQLMLNSNYDCKFIEGHEMNFKVTTKIDFILLTEYLKNA